MKETVGVLLAGGESRRFGKPKAFASYNGKYFWEHSFSALKAGTDQQVIISHPDFFNKLQEEAACRVLKDDCDVKGKGPLAGIYTAMNNEKAEWYVILACDVPLITKHVIISLLNFRQPSIKAVIPNVNGKLQPLIGVYHHSIFPLVKKQLLNNEYKMVTLLEKKDVLYVSEKELNVNPKIFRNINSQEDYTELRSNDKISESNTN